MRRLLTLALLCGAPALATSYTANVVNWHGTNNCGTITISGTSTALSGNSDVSTTWTPNGIPTLSDTCTISGFSYTYDGSTATSVTWNGSITMNGGLAGPSQHSVDTCSSSNKHYSSGKTYTLTLTANGLSSTQAMFLYNAPGTAPTYSIWNHICYAELYPGAGRVITHYGAFGLTDQSVEELSYARVHGGSDVYFVDGLGDLEIHNVSRDTAPTASLVNSSTSAATIGSSTTMAGTIGSAAVTFGSVYGLTPPGGTVAGPFASCAKGALVTGAGIPAFTTLASVATYSGTSGTLSTPLVAGFTSGETVTVYAQGNICASTVAGDVGNATTTMAVLHDAVGGYPPYFEDSNAANTDTGGVYALGLTDNFLTGSNNLLLSHATGTTYTVGMNATGISATNYPQMTHNAVDGAFQDAKAPDNMVMSHNFLGQQGPQSITGQGIIEMQGLGCPFSSDHNVYINYADPSTELFLSLNNAAGTSGAPCPSFNHDTFIMLGTASGDTTCMLCFGEYNLGSSFPVTNATVKNSIVYNNTANKYTGIQCRDQQTTFASTGPSGVGIYGNDLWAPGWAGSGAGYLASYSPCTNFGTGHPNSAYNDTNLNPNFRTLPANAVAAWSRCDLSLVTANGGSGGGSESNIFGTEMFNRYQFDYSPDYTPSQMVDCLISIAAPTNQALATAAADGTTPGASAIAPLSVVFLPNPVFP